MRQSSLTLLLPHGFDGTGPEHSSSKIERFLQLIDSNCILQNQKIKNKENNPENNDDYDHRKINFCIAQPTTPANYFHLLRRQMLREYRKPLVVFTPKIGLRSPHYISLISDFGPMRKFEAIISDKFGDLKEKNLVFCTGQIFIEVKKACDKYLEKNKKEANLVLIRLEELAPFPENKIIEVLNAFEFSENSKALWIQEESMNMGAFSYIQPSLNRILSNLNEKIKLEYIGRNAQCGAIGCVEEHKKEYEILLKSLEEFVEKC